MSTRRGSRGRLRAFGRETPALVGVITREEDWRLLLDEHWYRIPVRTAPESLPGAAYLAWYQTSVFGAEKWAVNWYARIAGLTKVRRIDLLPDDPHHERAEELYYRVDVDGLLRLPNPIPSRKSRRIVFIPTSLERLFVAREINDLYKISPIEEELYCELADAGLDPERQFFVRESGTGYMLDMALFCRDGVLDIECDGERYHSGKEAAARDRARDNALTSAGWRVLRFSGKEILDQTGECMRVVRQTVKKLGGVEKVKAGKKSQKSDGRVQNAKRGKRKTAKSAKETSNAECRVSNAEGKTAKSAKVGGRSGESKHQGTKSTKRK